MAQLPRNPTMSPAGRCFWPRVVAGGMQRGLCRGSARCTYGIAPAADATAALVQLGNTVTKESDQDPEHCSAWLIQSGVLF